MVITNHKKAHQLTDIWSICLYSPDEFCKTCIPELLVRLAKVFLIQHMPTSIITFLLKPLQGCAQATATYTH